MNSMSKRVFDLILCFIFGILLFIVFAAICIAIKITSKGPIFHLSKRVGKNNKFFLMPKFRTMKTDTPQLATHLLDKPEEYLTPIGDFLRKSSLDELPQFFSVLKGDMCFVGPRPALYNQEDLIFLRTQAGVHTLIPGITGWAQINGRDDIELSVKVKYDEYYLNNQSFWLDIKIIFLTIIKVLKSEGVKH